MSSSDQQVPLTRRQMREMGLTAPAPVISLVPEPKRDEEDFPPELLSPDAVPQSRRHARELAKLHTGALAVVEQPELDQPAASSGLEPKGVSAAALNQVTPEVSGRVATPVKKKKSAKSGRKNKNLKPVAVDNTGHDQVAANFGQQLLDAPLESKPKQIHFDDVVEDTQTSGSTHTSSSLILAVDPHETGAQPITVSGGAVVTGSLSLPEGFASHGHVVGVTDGAEADAALFDTEIPAAASPTPVAASSAISTIKPAAEVLRPPTPEKGSRLMLALTITAGALAVAVAAALIAAFTSGVF